MNDCYRHLSAEARAAIMMMRATHSIRAIAIHLGHLPSTVSLETARYTVVPHKGYDADLAGYGARLMRHKLHPDGELFEEVVYLLCYWSPEQIARTHDAHVSQRSCRQASHEVTYSALYLMPRSSFKKELVA